MTQISRGAAADGSSPLLRTALAVTLALASTGCQLPGATQANGTTPQTPFNPANLVNLTQGQANGSILGLNNGSNRPPPVITTKPKPKPDNSGTPAAVVGDKGTDGNGTFPDRDQLQREMDEKCEANPDLCRDDGPGQGPSAESIALAQKQREDALRAQLAEATRERDLARTAFQEAEAALNNADDAELENGTFNTQAVYDARQRLNRAEARVTELAGQLGLAP